MGAIRLRKYLALFALLLSILPFVCVTAQSSNNLQWNVTENQQIQYQITRSSEVYRNNTTAADEISYVVVATIDGITDISDNIASPLDIDYLPISLTFENKSAFNNPLSPFPLYTPLILPTGNWSLLTSIYSDVLHAVYTNVSINNDPELWEYTSSINQYDSGSFLDIKYSKADGVMSSLKSTIVFSGYGSIGWEIVRINPIDISLAIIILCIVGLASIILPYGWKRKAGQ
jgi:hypothetical protein